MAVPSLNRDSVDAIVDGLDGIILRLNLQDKIGGVGLDATGFAPAYIRTGHLVIHNPAVAGSFKPMPLNTAGDGYGELPEDYAYYGVVVNSVMKQGTAFAVGVCVRGDVNPAVVNTANGVFGISGDLLTAVKTALPLITFRADND